MEIPHTVTARPDTGLYNAKLAIWLFLASEVMLFGGLFSAYVFLRMGADDGYWSHGLLDVPVGTFNTLILISSSITIVLAWASLKMRQWARHKIYLAATILLGVLFLGIKLGYEYPAKFKHFGVFIKKSEWAKYDDYLGNKHLADAGLPPRPEITGHLEKMTVDITNADKEKFEELLKNRDLKAEIPKAEAPKEEGKGEKAADKANLREIEIHSPRDAEALRNALGVIINPDEKDPTKIKRMEPGVKAVEFEMMLDEVNADPSNGKYDRPSFFVRGLSNKVTKIDAADVDWWSAFYPKHSSYFAVYFLITALHGLHVLGGIVIFTYFFFWGHKIYRRNPEQQTNRIEVAGLYWHFVDLVWIFVFPVFYLL